MILKNKYNEIMDRVKVDAAMRERVLRALEQEDAGIASGAAEGMEVSNQDAERTDPGIVKQETTGCREGGAGTRETGSRQSGAGIRQTGNKEDGD